ncbi:MAG: hypothetical protein JKY43_04515 [Phycisphaerales bacterium]|nr:hypothetical protein [Phycisphaerales bacterium]
MRNLLMAAAIASLAGVASADVYMDTAGDLNASFVDGGGVPFAHLDITQVEITNDANFLYIDISVAGDIDATNWGKYLVGFDMGSGTTSTSGGWGRNISWGSGIDYFIGGWADEGGSGVGAELRNFDGAAWNVTDATYLGGGLIMGDDSAHAAGVQSYIVSLAALGLSVGDTFGFDVATTGGGGGDPGVDMLSLAGEATPDWGTGSTSGAFLSYTVIPTPSSLALLGLGGLVAGRRRR